MPDTATLEEYIQKVVKKLKDYSGSEDGLTRRLLTVQENMLTSGIDKASVARAMNAIQSRLAQKSPSASAITGITFIPSAPAAAGKKRPGSPIVAAAKKPLKNSGGPAAAAATAAAPAKKPASIVSKPFKVPTSMLSAISEEPHHEINVFAAAAAAKPKPKASVAPKSAAPSAVEALFAASAQAKKETSSAKKVSSTTTTQKKKEASNKENAAPSTTAAKHKVKDDLIVHDDDEETVDDEDDEEEDEDEEDEDETAERDLDEEEPLDPIFDKAHPMHVDNITHKFNQKLYEKNIKEHYAKRRAKDASKDTPLNKLMRKAKEQPPANDDNDPLFKTIRAKYAERILLRKQEQLEEIKLSLAEHEQDRVVLGKEIQANPSSRALKNKLQQLDDRIKYLELQIETTEGEIDRQRGIIVSAQRG